MHCEFAAEMYSDTVIATVERAVERDLSIKGLKNMAARPVMPGW